MINALGDQWREGTGIFAPEVLAANRAEASARIKAYEDNQAAAIAENKATQAAENERLSSLTVPDEDEYWGLSEETLNWENPFPKRPGTVPGRYERFDYTVPGSGIAGGGNYAEAFDRAFSSQWKQEAPGLSEMQQQLLGGTSFIGGQSIADLSGSNLPSEAVAVAEFNQKLRDQQSRHRTYTTNKEYLQAFESLGIDPSTITSPEALAAITPIQKAAVFDLVQRQLQAKNQRAKPFGFGDALGIGLTLASLTVGNPYAAATLAASGSAAGGGNLKDIALAGGLAGLGNWAGGKFDAWAESVKAANAAKTGTAAATGIKSLGTAAGWGNLALDVTGKLIDPTIRTVGQNLFAESPLTPPDDSSSDSSSDSQGGTFSGVTDSITQGMGSLPQAAPSFVDPTPYLGVADLSPAFMNQFERGNLAIPPGTPPLIPAFMSQLERGNTAIPSGGTSLNPAFMSQLERGNTAIPSGVASLNPAFMNQLERAELGMT